MKISHSISIVSLLFFTVSANAISNNTWKNISNYSVNTLAATALLLPVAKSDWQGFRQATYSIAGAESMAFIGKQTFNEQRPDNSGNDSFPSGHTSAAFASATTLYKRYGWQIGAPAYALATLTAVGRVKARKHHWYDVVVGAAIGSTSGWYFTDAFNNKVQLIPWADTHSAGLTVSMRF
ncbi:MAG: phosphatase PAP2 family protein [Gammaproteobacteria bacterium]|nr:MAG: phosphatase PAP2 family protein [Gammaproteobacteria bacterium]